MSERTKDADGLGLRLAPGQDPMARQQNVCLDRATQRAAGGSEVGSFNRDLLSRVTACARINADPGDPDAADQAVQTSEAVVAAMRGFKPADEVEGMLAAQATMLHHVAMDAGRRAMRSSQSPEVVSKLRKDAANSARAMVEMIDALARYRGKGPQVIRVERMMVAEGGQAVVGNVTAGTALPVAGAAPKAIGRRKPSPTAVPADIGGGDGA